MLNSASAKEKTEPPKKRGRKAKIVQETSEVKKDVGATSDVIKDEKTVIDAEKTIKHTSGSDKEDVDDIIQPKKHGRAAKEAKVEEPVARKISKTAKKPVAAKLSQDSIDKAEKKQVPKKQKKTDILVKPDQNVLPKTIDIDEQNDKPLQNTEIVEENVETTKTKAGRSKKAAVAKDAKLKPDQEVLTRTSDIDEQNDKPSQRTEIAEENVEQPKKKAGRSKKATVVTDAKTEPKNAKESQMVEGASRNTEAAEQMQPKKKGKPKKVAAEAALNPVVKRARATKTDGKKKAAGHVIDSNSESAEAKEAVDSDYEPEKKVKGGKAKVVKEKNNLSGSDDNVKPKKVTKKVAKTKVALESVVKPSEKMSDEPASEPVKPKPVKGAQTKKKAVKKPPVTKKNKTDDNNLDEQEKQEDGPGVMDVTYDV